MRTSISLLAGIAIVAGLSACDSNDSRVAGPAQPSAKEQVDLRIIHAVANAPSVDVGNAAATFAAGLDFKQSTGYLPFITGTLELQVDANVPGGQVTVIGPATVDLAAGNAYTILAVGEVGSMATPIEPLVLANPAAAVGAGMVRVEVVHAAPSAPPVDIYVTAPTDPIQPGTAIAGGSTPYGATSGPLEIPGGDYRIRVTLPGQQTAVFDSGTVTLPAGADLLVLAVDNTVAGRAAAGAPPITLAVADGTGTFEILDADTPAEVRVVHAVPDANLVDVYVNDAMAQNAPAIEDLDFAQVVPGTDAYLPLSAGTTNVLVTVADNPGAIAIPATDVALEAGRQYTVYASGTLAAGIAPYVTGDDDRSVATEARTRIVHLAPSAGLVDIYITAQGADIANLAPSFAAVDFGDDTGYVSLAGGTYDVTVTLAGTKTAAIGPATVRFDDGGVYTAVARDPDADLANDGFGLILLDDF